MSFRIDPSKPFAHEVISAGQELIDGAVTILSEQPDGPHTAVHDARKKFKRLRALYRLVQKDAPEFRDRENARFRDIARSLAGARDAAALVETVDHLIGHSTSQPERQALSTVHEILGGRRDRIVLEDGDIENHIKAAIAQCSEGREALSQLSLPEGKDVGAKRVANIWKKQRDKALSALEQCHMEANSEHFHELRKCGQTYWMHLALLRRLWPSAMRAKQNDAKHMVDLLGYEHDLSVLAAFADRETGDFPDAEILARLLGAIISRQQALREESLELAARVFSESADSESGIVRLLWKHRQK